MAKQRVVVVSPRGRAIYPHLHAPDTKFDVDGVYRVKIAVPTAAAEEIVKKLDDLVAKSVEDAKKQVGADPKLKAKLKVKAKGGELVKQADLPYYTNPENEDETILSFKMKAQFTNPKTNEVVKLNPGLFDAKGKPLPKGTRVGGGSILRVSFEPIPFFTGAVGAGISLRMQAVQVIDLKKFGGPSFSGAGFEAEDGYEAEDEDASNSDFGPEKTEAKAEGTESTEDTAAEAGNGSDF